MISVDEAKQKIVEHTTLLPDESVKVIHSAGYVLARDVVSPISLPSFRQSSMDGYALSHNDVVHEAQSLPVAGEVRAGEVILQNLVPGTAVRIFTGAAVPEGATAVVMQEHTIRSQDQVMINEYPIAAGKNIRSVGQQIMKGSVALPAGTMLGAGSVGFLMGMNVTEVSVHSMPKVGILITGDELIRPGDDLLHGQVYESNSSMLEVALRSQGVKDIEICYASDELGATIDALRQLSETNDVVLASGGISVGDYDFVGKALEMVGADTIFYKVRQKPGKPLLFAKGSDTLYFALPGNPASSLVCYYEYVFPAIRKMTGHTDCFLRSIKLPIQNDYSFNGERDEFLKAVANEAEVIPLDGQESFALRSFALANALIYLPSSQSVVKKGDLVEVHLLPLG